MGGGDHPSPRQRPIQPQLFVPIIFDVINLLGAPSTPEPKVQYWDFVLQDMTPDADTLVAGVSVRAVPQEPKCAIYSGNVHVGNAPQRDSTKMSTAVGSSGGLLHGYVLARDGTELSIRIYLVGV